jgi:hypothetical protein
VVNIHWKGDLMLYLLVFCLAGAVFETIDGECRTVHVYAERHDCRAAANRVAYWADRHAGEAFFACIRGPGAGK